MSDADRGGEDDMNPHLVVADAKTRTRRLLRNRHMLAWMILVPLLLASISELMVSATS